MEKAKGILFHDNKLYTKESIIAVTEGLWPQDSQSRLKLPNFHAIQFYTTIPFPAIVCRVLDFGITVRTKIDRTLAELYNSNHKLFLERIQVELNKSFKETAQDVKDYILYRISQFDSSNIYDNADSFIKEESNNLWNIYCEKSQILKDHNAKVSFYRYLREYIEELMKDVDDKSQYELYIELKKYLLDIEKEQDATLSKSIKKIISDVHIKESISIFIDNKLNDNKYTQKIVIAA